MFGSFQLLLWVLLGLIYPSICNPTPLSLDLNNATILRNVSSSDIAGPHHWPWTRRFKIPSSGIELILHRHVIRPRLLDRGVLDDLFRTIEEDVAQAVRDYGAGADYPFIPDKDREQSFYCSLGGDIEILLENFHDFILQWGDLQDIFRGLRLWMVAGRRPYETEYEAVLGNTLIARGRVGRVI